MGDASEREFLEKIMKIKAKSNKKFRDVRSDFAEMQN